VVKEEIDSVLLGLDRVITRAGAQDHHICDPNLDPTRRARVGTNFALDFDRSFEGEGLEGRPGGFSDYLLNYDALQSATSVPHDDEGNFP
jgi:hypothetical protein